MPSCVFFLLIFYFCQVEAFFMKNILSKFQHKSHEWFKVVSFVIAIVLVMWFLPRVGKFKYEFQAGKPWNHPTLYAPFDFAIHKSDRQLSEERDRIENQNYPYFEFDAEATSKARELLLQILDEKLPDQLLNRRKTRQLAMKIFETVQNRGVVQHHKVLEKSDKGQRIQVVRDRVASVYALSDLFTIASAYDFATRMVDTARFVDKQLVLQLVSEAFVQNLVYNEKMSKQELLSSLEKMSETYGLVQQGELIISGGDVVNEDKFMKINSLRTETEHRTGDFKRANTLLAGQFILVIAVFATLYFFIRFLRNELFNELKKINLILLLMLLTILPSYLILSREAGLVYLLPFGLLPIILITFFDSRITVLVHLLTIFLVSIVVPNAFQFVFLQLIVGYVVVFSLDQHGRRVYFFRTSGLIFLTYLIIYTGFSFIQVSEFSLIDTKTIWFFALSAALTLLALPMIYFLERLFGFITDLTLLELSNTNSPLLRELASRAPGTFQHSMQVANFAEEALYAIGGNVLLARTGALYHDIGKMAEPFYYIENQMGSYNPHDDLMPIESAEIIIGHVIKGIEMARNANIPDQIIDFIRTHHGTSRVNYFYVMQQRLNPGLRVDERDFCYPGPLPFSKETAVVMMADSVEAASRSMKEPNEQKINDLVENIIAKQIETNQFVNANITFRDIRLVKSILKKKLLNSYHVRIAYPE